VYSVTLNGRTTTSLGFGGSLLGSTSAEASRKLLRAAYKAGIRHFDVAPMYGFGKSERLLREALGDRPDITITTKYGLAPPANSSFIAPIHQFARNVLTPFPGLRRSLQLSTGRLQRSAGGETPSDPPLSAVEAEKSIENSLRELGTLRIDLLLLHEATPERLIDERLLSVLERSKAAGKIGEFGVGSRSDRLIACVEQCPEYCRFLQYEWSAFSTVPSSLEDYPHINHGSLRGVRADFIVSLMRDDDLLKRWCDATNADLRTPGMINRLLLKASILHNAGHIVLFSTRSLANIQNNVRTSQDARLDASATALQQLIQAEYMPYRQSPGVSSGRVG